LPVVLLGIGALSCLAIREGKRAPKQEEPEAAKTETPTTA
jgi:hypothetical protein